jgi:hypothetical protein
MADATGLQYGVGARYVAAFLLDDLGTPLATDKDPYVGELFSGFHAWNVTAPGMKRIDHKDNDSIAVSDFLPPDTSGTAELTVGVDNIPLNALLGATKVIEFGESQASHWMTDKQGFEPDVALFMFQQAKDKTTRARTWRWHLAPSCLCVPQLTGMSENPQEIKYEVILNKSTKTIFGVPLTEAVDGCLESALLSGMSNGRPCIVFWKANGSSDEAFAFPVGVTALAAGNVTVFSWVTGALVSPSLYDVDVDLQGLTFDAAPAEGVYGAFIEY